MMIKPRKKKSVAEAAQTPQQVDPAALRRVLRDLVVVEVAPPALANLLAQVKSVLREDDVLIDALSKVEGFQAALAVASVFLIAGMAVQRLQAGGGEKFQA